MGSNHLPSREEGGVGLLMGKFKTMVFKKFEIG